MKTDIIQIFNSIFDAQGVHTMLLSPPYSSMHEADYGFRGHIFEDFNYEKQFNLLQKTTDELPILIFKDDFLVEYCLIYLPEKFQKTYNATHYLIGPVLFTPMTDIEISDLLQKLHLPAKLCKDFAEFYNSLPLLPNIDFMISLLSPLINTLFSGEPKHQYLEVNENLPDRFDVKDSVFSLEVIEARYQAERDLLEAVASGNLDKAIEEHHKFQRFRFNLRASNSLRSRKNLALSLNTLLRKSIETAHVHPYYIDKLSSEFSVKIEKCVNESQLETLAMLMLRKYCNLVKNYSTQNFSALVEKCVQQIHFHYAEPLSLEILAEANAVSNSYLSNLFHKETGKTITAYINETRIDHSILLLNTTSLSISEIASQCGFSDSNYFTRTFKKIKGISPAAYRKSVLETI